MSDDAPEPRAAGTSPTRGRSTFGMLSLCLTGLVVVGVVVLAIWAKSLPLRTAADGAEVRRLYAVGVVVLVSGNAIGAILGGMGIVQTGRRRGLAIAGLIANVIIGAAILAVTLLVVAAGA